MSTTLTLIQAGWESVQSTAERGQRTDALTQVTRLLAHPDLPVSLAAEARRLAGELSLEAERYPEARRHLRAAAALEPASARTFYLWGQAFESDPHGCDRRAALRFRKAVELEPANPLYRAAFGRAAVRCGKRKFGVRTLLVAANNAPAELTVLRVVIEGLLEAGAMSAVRRVIQQARFLCPGNCELATLGNRVRFETARRTQRELGGTTRHRQDAELARDGGRVVLPFVRVVSESARKPESTGNVRRDIVSLPKPHFPRLRVRKADR